MKIRLLLLFFALVLAAPMAHASFPVERSTSVSTSISGETIDGTMLISPAAGTLESDTFLIAILLFIFLWPLAAHRWYLGSPIGWNILFILTLGGVGIWAIVDLIDILTKKYPGL